MYTDGVLFADAGSSKVCAVARRLGPGQWEWWLTISRWDSELAAVVEEYIDGGTSVDEASASRHLGGALGALFG